MEIKKYIKDNMLIIDGGMGTMLQGRGLQTGQNPEAFGYEHPEILVEIHKEYFEAGANVATTCTFGCNELKLPEGYEVEQIVDSAVKAAKKAATLVNNGNEKYVALDIGPIGEMLEPMGTLSFDRAYEIFKRQVVQGQKSGADLIIVETMMDLYEIKAALLAAKENTDLPVFTTMTFDENGRSFTGCLPESMVVTLQGLGADAVGVNCSLGPEQLKPMVEKIIRRASVPVIVQPNAGLPDIEDGKTVYKMTAEQFLEGVSEFVKMGATIVGGCCGTNPEFIKALADNVKNIKVEPLEKNLECVVCSPSKILEINGPTIRGERLNPTGRKPLQDALISGDLDYVVSLGLDQVEEGAEILNMNVGLPELDEKAMMPKVIKTLQEIINVPIQLDSSNVDALEQGLRYYNGRTIVNSINGKEESLNSILPIVQKYGAAVVGLTLDENGIPKTAEGRFEIAKKIVERAESYGVRRQDIFIDCLSLTVSAQQEEAMETIKAMRMVKENLGCKTILGVSNISFGVPNRSALNSTFLNLALGAGLDLAIINTSESVMMESMYAYRVISNIDKGCEKYIEKYMNVSKSKNDKAKAVEINEETSLDVLIERGLKDETKNMTYKLLEEYDGNYILDNMLIPALDKVGVKYDKGEIFLPQMIQAAETIKVSLNIIKDKLSVNTNDSGSTKGKIIVATVKGDIHDIGKNIVKIMLENYGYEVIDLGKDVPIETVVETAKAQNIKLIGLSALMTTTVQNMKDTIKAIRDAGIDAKVIVGGAVLTEEYAKQIDADYYAKDAKRSVEIAKITF
ncbi:homocysteine S-methyltransferase family protein [Intestinibacter sp.]|uniref:homocysteine S-methyltransferase family protein n=1 Tax=Intestinibacter sp. TaxID=1965304 RepID=UPI002A761D49|nr:homocysteine S-methyltransferase family protein [Intestinibacter sp.]MDY2737991.1 homocysteine S-methyltransferase family protein [Intestinibacter sp.]